MHPVRPPSTLILVLVLARMVSGSTVDDDQSAVLLKFKTALGNSDPALADWGTTGSGPCSGNMTRWSGVVCSNSYVWGLQLENMGLEGQIDVDTLVGLKYLRTLSFMKNRFQGSMPDWRKLGALKNLYLSNNRFNGEIAIDGFKGMTSLKKVHLANNGFSGPIPVSLESPKLIELRLENNQFTGNVPTISSEMLKVFNVSNNKLEGEIPENLSKLDPTSFSGNADLCGKPLKTPCNPPIPPSDLDLGSPPTPMADVKSAKDDNGDHSVAKIAMIILSTLVCLFLIMLILIVCLCSGKDATPRLGREMSYMSNASVAGAEVGIATVASSPSSEPVVLPTGARRGDHAPSQAGKLTFVRGDKQKFDLQDLMRASAEVLGSGTFGASYKAVLEDGEAMVVKRFKQMNNVAKEDFHEHMRRLGRLEHPNLLPLVAYLYRKEEKLLVFDYVNNSSLAKHLHVKHSEEQPGLSWATRLKIIKGIAKAITYLHNELPSLTLPHGHLKSSNVLLDNDFNPLLMDYTLVPIVNPNEVHQILVGYKSPEYAQTYRISRKSDVWCLGILILEILTGKFAIAQGCGHHAADLAGWIHAIVEEVKNDEAHAFDKDMGVSSENCRHEMEKLLKIGIACCEEDMEKRWDLEEAVKQIQRVHETTSRFV